jgi:hypothetical protein
MQILFQILVIILWWVSLPTFGKFYHEVHEDWDSHIVWNVIRPAHHSIMSSSRNGNKVWLTSSVLPTSHKCNPYCAVIFISCTINIIMKKKLLNMFAMIVASVIMSLLGRILKMHNTWSDILSLSLSLYFKFHKSFQVTHAIGYRTCKNT